MKPTTALSLSITLSAIVVVAQQTPRNLRVTSAATLVDDSLIPLAIQGANGVRFVDSTWPHTNGIWIVEGGSGAPTEFLPLSELVWLPPRALRQAFTASTVSPPHGDPFKPFPPVWLGQRRADVPDTNWQVRVVQLNKIATRP